MDQRTNNIGDTSCWTIRYASKVLCRMCGGQPEDHLGDAWLVSLAALRDWDPTVGPSFRWYLGALSKRAGFAILYARKRARLVDSDAHERVEAPNKAPWELMSLKEDSEAVLGALEPIEARTLAGVVKSRWAIRDSGKSKSAWNRRMPKKIERARDLVLFSSQLEGKEHMASRPAISPANHEFAKLLDQIKDLQHKIRDHMQSQADRIRSREDSADPPNTELVDFGFLCREVADTADEIRKDCNAHMALASRIVCIRETEKFVANPEDSEVGKPIRGSLATGSTDVKVIVDQPQKGQHEYHLLMKYLGVPEDLIVSGLVKPSWKGINDLATECEREGKPMPPGLGKKRPEYIVTYRRKRGGNE